MKKASFQVGEKPIKTPQARARSSTASRSCASGPGAFPRACPGRRRPPYDENLIALAGYEMAAVESGYLPSDVRLVVRLGPDGEYDATESHATEDVFLAAKTAHREKAYLTKPRPEAVPA